MDKREAEKLMILASAIDSRKITDAAVTVWQMVLADVNYSDAEVAYINHRRNEPGVYLEPGHILQQIKMAHEKRRELYGIHPKAPEGKQWAVDVMDSMKELEA